MYCCSRRRFIRTAVAATGALYALPETFAQGAPETSRVVIAKNPAVTDGGDVVESTLAEMVDAAVVALTGEADAAKAWSGLFSSDEVIGLKPNGLGGPMLSTHQALIHICVERLTSVGLKAENLVIWDQDASKLIACGLDPGTTWGVPCVPMDSDLDGPTESGSFSGRITSIVTKKIDGYINLPIIKDHNLAGVTGALKAHYGSIDNPGEHHADGCDPYIADLYSVPAIKDKSRLILTDGTRATCEGGPVYNPMGAWNANLIIAATDPVANDAQIHRIVNERREEVGLPPLEMAGREPKHIATAAARGLGNNDPSRIEVEELALG
ncbi:MAG TPA: DUF362 domain-containing protein [Armatimonadota bacterium]|nr:DUF362 domain-containing protein [Armatimonadota bacterium]